MKVSSNLLDDLARSLDPVGFSAELGIAPDDWQADLLTTNERAILLNCSRQSGKSTVTALKALHTALYDPGLILMLAPAQRQSIELFRKLKGLYTSLDGLPGSVNESAMALELENGSRIVALPGSEASIRGYSAPKLIIVDEAARTDDSLFTAIRPMLATSQGQLIALSTPFGKRGWYYEQWIGGNGWKRYKVLASDCPRISDEYLQQERSMIGEWQYSQEFECAFVDTQEQFFNTELIARAMIDMEPLWD
jgi:hypothetical protein